MKTRILIIEDHKSWVDLYLELLSGEFSITTANTFQDAMNCLEKNIYDLFILDLRLDISSNDNVDGLILLNKIKNRHSSAHTIVVSGYPEVLESNFYKTIKPTFQFKKSTFDKTLFKQKINEVLNIKTKNEQ